MTRREKRDVRLYGRGVPGKDTTAIHVDEAGEIAAIANANIAAGDYIVFEDASDGNAKKQDTVQGLLDLGGSGIPPAYLMDMSGGTVDFTAGTTDTTITPNLVPGGDYASMTVFERSSSGIRLDYTNPGGGSKSAYLSQTFPNALFGLLPSLGIGLRLTFAALGGANGTKFELYARDGTSLRDQCLLRMYYDGSNRGIFHDVRINSAWNGGASAVVANWSDDSYIFLHRGTTEQQAHHVTYGGGSPGTRSIPTDITVEWDVEPSDQDTLVWYVWTIPNSGDIDVTISEVWFQGIARTE